MKRYEDRVESVRISSLVEHCCDGCGIWAQDAEFGLTPVAIEVNVDEGILGEFGSRDEYDYCNDCLIERAEALLAAGSRSEIVGYGSGDPPTGSEGGSDDE